jgi:hypothetical protein
MLFQLRDAQLLLAQLTFLATKAARRFMFLEVQALKHFCTRKI